MIRHAILAILRLNNRRLWLASKKSHKITRFERAPSKVNVLKLVKRLFANSHKFELLCAYENFARNIRLQRPGLLGSFSVMNPIFRSVRSRPLLTLLCFNLGLTFKSGVHKEDEGYAFEGLSRQRITEKIAISFVGIKKNRQCELPITSLNEIKNLKPKANGSFGFVYESEVFVPKGMSSDFGQNLFEPISEERSLEISTVPIRHELLNFSCAESLESNIETSVSEVSNYVKESGIHFDVDNPPSRESMKNCAMKISESELDKFVDDCKIAQVELKELHNVCDLFMKEVDELSHYTKMLDMKTKQFHCTCKRANTIETVDDILSQIALYQKESPENLCRFFPSINTLSADSDLSTQEHEVTEEWSKELLQKITVNETWEEIERQYLKEEMILPEKRVSVILKMLLNDTSGVADLDKVFAAEIMPFNKPTLHASPYIVNVFCSFIDKQQKTEDVLKWIEKVRKPDVKLCDQTVYLVMQKYQGNLQSYLKEHKLTVNQSLQIMTQLLEALRSLQLEDVAHRDIKSNNILFSTHNDCLHVVLADFGCASPLKLDFPSFAVSRGGNSLLMAPEICVADAGPGKVLDFSKADLWSLGTVAYEVFNGRNPLHYCNIDKETYNTNELPALPESCPVLVANLIIKMLARQPVNRPNVHTACLAFHLLLWMPKAWTDELPEGHLPSDVQIVRWLLIETVRLRMMRAAKKLDMGATGSAVESLELQLRSIFLSQCSLDLIKDAFNLLCWQ